MLQGVMNMRRVFEITISILAVCTSCWLMFQLWSYLSSPNYGGRSSLWPAPAGYLVEVVLLSVLALICVVKRNSNFDNISFLWFLIGALLSMVILGAFSIGPSIAPTAIGFIVVGISMSYKRRKRVMRYITMLLGGLIIQSLIMIVL